MLHLDIGRTFISVLAIAAALTSCGGGGGGSDSGTSNTVNPSTGADPSASQPATTTGASENILGTSCAVADDADVFGRIPFETSQPIDAKPYGCLIVSKSDGHPVRNGLHSARFEVRPTDCSASTTWNDCTNDRSRHEINEVSSTPTNGKILTYTTNLFIPSQATFRPKGSNIMFLAQINFVNEDIYGTSAYLEVDENGNLMIRTHLGFSWDIKSQYPIYTNPFGKWIEIKYEIKSSDSADGYIKVYVDGLLKVDENRATLPTANSRTLLKIGIYNAFKSEASQTYENQHLYYDDINKVVQ